MINYLCKFLPQLSDVSEPLRNLPKEQIQYSWSQVCEDTFKKVTKLIFELPLLSYNDLEEEIAIESDASVHGLEAVLLQGGRPVGFTSRTMMEIQILREK